MEAVESRKNEHLSIVLERDVGFKRSALFECVTLVHEPLPELSIDTLDLGVSLFAKRLRAPLVIAAMTGGTERALRVNLELAAIAEELGYGFGLGSQRPMLNDPATWSSFQVRSVAPNALVLANLGIVQARGLPVQRVADLVGAVGADAICVHMNPAMELIQAEGDRDFSGCIEALAALVEGLPVPVIGKETGSGIGPATARRLRAAGVRHVDVSGAGGTSWVAVETERAPEERRHLGAVFREWGVPTLASVGLLAKEGFDSIIATGGIKSGLDVAKALAVGADAVGMARSVLNQLETSGAVGTKRFLQQIEEQLRVAMLLCGAPSVLALRRVPRLVSGELSSWLALEAGK